LLDPAPDIAVALAQVGGRLLDGAGLFDGLEHFREAEAENVVAVGFEPHFHAGHQRRRFLSHGQVRETSMSGATEHGGLYTGSGRAVVGKEPPLDNISIGQGPAVPATPASP